VDLGDECIRCAAADRGAPLGDRAKAFGYRNQSSVMAACRRATVSDAIGEGKT
jgi:hypothetical protein